MPLLSFIIITHNSITLINIQHAFSFLEIAAFNALWFKQGHICFMQSLQKVRG